MVNVNGDRERRVCQATAKKLFILLLKNPFCWVRRIGISFCHSNQGIVCIAFCTVRKMHCTEKCNRFQFYEFHDMSTVNRGRVNKNRDSNKWVTISIFVEPPKRMEFQYWNWKWGIKCFDARSSFDQFEKCCASVRNNFRIEKKYAANSPARE